MMWLSYISFEIIDLFITEVLINIPCKFTEAKLSLTFNFSKIWKQVKANLMSDPDLTSYYS